MNGFLKLTYENDETLVKMNDGITYESLNVRNGIGTLSEKFYTYILVFYALRKSYLASARAFNCIVVVV